VSQRGRDDRGDHQALTPDQLVTFVLQDHRNRNGRHTDVRLGTPDLGLLSWATRYDLPMPGERPRALYQTPIHPYSWGSYQGPVRGGDVRVRERGRARVVESGPDRLGFQLIDRDPIDEYLLRKMTENAWLATRRGPRTDGAAPEQAKQADIRDDIRLQPHQERARKRLSAPGSRVLLYHGLGTGKTISSIAAADAAGEPYVAVVPAALRAGFRDEINKATDNATPSQVMSYNEASVRDPAIQPRTLIVDESQRVRNPNASVSRGIQRLANQADRVIMLSGTPIVNGPGDLAAPLSILTGKPMSAEAFERRYVADREVGPGFWGWLRGEKPTVEKTIANRDELARLFSKHVDYQAPSTPYGVDVSDERVDVDMSPDQARFHDLMWRKLPLVLRWKIQNQFPLAPREINRLTSFMTGPRQAALSLAKYTDNDPARAFTGSTKLQEAARRLVGRLGQDDRTKALVFSNFPNAGLTPYADHLRRSGIPTAIFDGKLNDDERRQMLANYNAGRLRVLMAGPAAAEGISTKGTQLIQVLDPHFNAARVNQSIGRGLRFDSHTDLPEDLKKVHVERYVARTPDPNWLMKLLGAKRRPSSDEVLYDLAEKKEKLNEQFRKLLREAGRS